MKPFCFRLPLLIHGLLSAVSFMSPSRADYVLPSVDFTNFTVSGIYRVDETTGLELTAGNVFPGAASGAGPYGSTDIAVGPDGNFYVTDVFSQKIFAFDRRTSQPLTSPHSMAPAGLFAGLEANMSSQFLSLTFGPDDRLYVLDGNLTAATDPEEIKAGIRVYDSSTGLLVDTLLEDTTQTFAMPSSIVFDNTGNLLMSDLSGGTIYSIDVDTDAVSIFSQGGVFTPAGMAIGPNGDVYVADLFFNQIIKLDSNGQNPEVFATIPPPESVGDQGHFPSDIVFDRDGNLLVAVLGDTNPATAQDTAAGRLLRYDLEGNLLETIIENLRPTPSVAIVDDLLPGDFNGDGYVDQDDYAVWKTQFGSEVTPTRGADANGDGVVDAADYTIWRNTLGATGLIGAPHLQSAAVPEPSTLLLAGLLGLLAFHRRALR